MEPPSAISENINGEKPIIRSEPEIVDSPTSTAQPSG